MVGGFLSITRQGARIMSNHSRKESVCARSQTVKNPFSLPRIGAWLTGLMLSSLVLIASASAATITVGNAGDPATGNAARCNAANTCTLRDAIAKAAAVTGTAAGDTIVFNLPAYSTITLSGSELLIDKNLIIDGSTVADLAISGNDHSRVVEISAGVTTTLKRLIIRNGKSSDGSGGGIYNRGALTLAYSTVANNNAANGGGIYTDNASLTLTGSTISNNTARVGGGIRSLSSTLKLAGGTVANNTADSGDGGGMIIISGALILTNSMVMNNTALSGGGIANYSGTVSLTSCTISGNTSGGIGNYGGILTMTDCMVSGNNSPDIAGGIYNNGLMTLIHSTVSGNRAMSSGLGGGGILNGFFLTLTDSKVSRNTATNGSGGGIYNYVAASATLIGSTISDNTAGFAGGGIYDNSGTLALANSTVSGNTVNGTYGTGGGIYANGFTLTNSTISGNTASKHSGGIYGGDITLIHATLAANISAGINDDIDRNAIASAANTIIQKCRADGGNAKVLIDNGGNLDGGIGCGFTNASSKSNATLDLGALADNGGPTLTMMPGANSDAIGRGVPSACVSSPVNSRDQRGYVRSAIACTSGAVDPGSAANDSIFFDGFGFGGQ